MSVRTTERTRAVGVDQPQESVQLATRPTHAGGIRRLWVREQNNNFDFKFSREAQMMISRQHHHRHGPMQGIVYIYGALSELK